jgi:hypothetical protein
VAKVASSMVGKGIIMRPPHQHAAALSLWVMGCVAAAKDHDCFSAAGLSRQQGQKLSAS